MGSMTRFSAYTTQGCVHNRVVDVDDVRNTIQDIRAKVIDGAQAVPNQ
jgi:hypothetical protein